MAAAKGQPSTAPAPMAKMPCAVRNLPPRQSMKAAMPSIVVYIAKLEGRYEILAWNIPGAVAIIITKMTPILGCRTAEMAE